jgi:hypothetical protein
MDLTGQLSNLSQELDVLINPRQPTLSRTLTQPTETWRAPLAQHVFWSSSLESERYGEA